MRRIQILTMMILLIPWLMSCSDREETAPGFRLTEVQEESVMDSETDTQIGEQTSEDTAESAGAGLSGSTEADREPAEAAAEQDEAVDRPLVRGIYVTGPVAGSERMNDLITLVDATQLNTMVIDVKNDDGEITWKMETDSVAEMGNGVAYIRDIDALMKTLKEHDI